MTKIIFLRKITDESIEKILQWKLGFNIYEAGNCFVLNFNFQIELPVPQISLNLENKTSLDKYFTRFREGVK